MKNRIKELRTEKKITQLQLSIILGVTQETISAYEHQKHLPSLSSLMQMSDIFDASMDYIMGISPIRHIAQVDATNGCAQLQELLNIYHRLSSKNKVRLEAYAKGLLDSTKD